jgi:hypothetical protein
LLGYLLFLGADQVIKINQNLAHGNGAVVAFYFNYSHQPAQQQAICQCISQITGIYNTTVCITSLPQALVNNKLYYGSYCDLLCKVLLKLLMADELQLLAWFNHASSMIFLL